ncbi:hypothetical protein WJX72_000063 [[Myrmecia] bisecta]|uniref:Peptidase M20 dimerisation domain-containing protein n=1 Tax=[Myrmecia] bisecta TaxID=41462 RepID=A0AAW1R5A1_9CHLO
MLKWLRHAYRLVWQKLEVEQVHDYSLLLRWQGSDAKLKPIVCISHTDVVPVNVESEWTHSPFGGVVADGYVWGRGAMDVKVMVVAMLEAVTQLLQDGFWPQRTVYFAFGHDEEVGGDRGAGATAKLLQDRGIEVELVLDEGGGVFVDGVEPFTQHPVAAVGTAEKGYISVELTVRSPGGHASMPPINGSTVAATLARVIANVEDAPPQMSIQQPVPDYLQALAPYAKSRLARPFLARSNHSVVGEMVSWWMVTSSGRPQLAALVRPTVAVVRLESDGKADNVLPQAGRAVFNFRTLPDTPPDFPEEYLTAMVGKEDMKHASLRRLSTYQASKVTPSDGKRFTQLRQAILETLAPKEGLIVAPTLVLGGTDSWHYQNISQGNILRFDGIPMNRTAGDGARVHGTDERCSIQDYLQVIKFYIRFLQLAAAS